MRYYNKYNYKHNDNYIKCYYLIYKLYNNNILWIAKISDQYHELLEILYNVRSNIEKYYIILKDTDKSIFNSRMKNFTQFTINKNCKILYET